MKNDDYIRLEFPSLSRNECFARSAVAAYALRLDPTMEELGDLKTAVSEAVTNAIVHAYPEKIGIVQLKAKVCGDVLTVTVKDHGRGIDDVQKARQPLYTTGGEERSGMGFTIMESFMDELRIRSSPGKGTTLTMKKRIKSRR